MLAWIALIVACPAIVAVRNLLLVPEKDTPVPETIEENVMTPLDPDELETIVDKSNASFRTTITDSEGTDKLLGFLTVTVIVMGSAEA